ncbi:DUF1351 domain-containing protein [Leptotrichia wadei]|uniref:DUF1351 domain-containing protein n=1 Tax=Leptotrichia wadei TaxID=157687 RepID=A0A510KDJ6_9FUSO|nr:DUF1351 domain-containing protein [Leptotrichia wadei]BBM49749.1 hypothetical protein JMUB3934_1045 [Leptotrichia wadei]
MSETQTLELVIKKITPAQVESNIEQLDTYMSNVTEHYKNWIVTEDSLKEAATERTKLNKLEKNLAEFRKRVQEEGLKDINAFIQKLKDSEKEVKTLSNNIKTQIDEFEEKQWEEKQKEIQKKINGMFVTNENLKQFVVQNPKWKNKTFTINKIESELSEQLENLVNKKQFIENELEKANKGIEFKIVFEAVQFLMNSEYSEIVKEIEKKRNETKKTEENLRQKANEEKRRALDEAEMQKQKEIEEIKKQQTVETAKKSTKQEKHYDTTIRFMNAPLSFLVMLKNEADRLGIETEKISSRQI